MRKMLRKLISAGLVLTMLVGLTACGGKDEQQASNNGKNSDPNAELAKQYVFSETALEMPDLGTDYNIRMLQMVNEKIYALADVYNWGDDGSYENSMKIISWNQDGTGMQMHEIQKTLGGEEKTETSEGQTKESTAEKKRVAVETAVADIAATDIAVNDPIMPESGVYEYTGISNCVISGAGIMYGIKNYTKDDYTDPANPISINDTYICGWSLDGVMQWETAIEDLQTDESWSYVQSIIPMADSKIMLLISGDKREKIEVSDDGTLSERKELAEGSSVLANTSEIFLNADGTFTVIYWDDSDGYNMKVATYDMENDSVSEGVKLPDYFNMYGYNSLSAGIGTDMIFSNSNGIFTYNIGDEQPVQILSYINSDMATTSMNCFTMVDDSHIIGFYYDNVTNKNKGGIFTKVNPEDIKDKKVLVLAGFYVDYNTKNRVVDFNKTNEEYRIVVKEYQQYSTIEDYMTGYTQLNNDIISGSMPDILIIDNNISLENYISKGLLADVGALIEKDEELSQKEFMENVFEAYKVDGTLYQVIPSFYVRTMIGKKSLVGDRDTWTMQDAQQLMATLPEGTMLVGDRTRTDFFYLMMQYCGNDFIDMSTGKCSFDSQGFKDLLEFTKELPEEFGEDHWSDEDYWSNYESQYRENRTVLMECYVSNARDMNRNINGYFGEEISYIGFPTESGKGSVLAADQMYALSAKSKNLDGAWEFVRYYLDDEYQNEIYNFPITRDAFMKKVNEAMEPPYYLDENDNKVEYEDIFYMNGEEIPLPNMTQKQADDFVSFVESVDKKMYYNQDVQAIIEEEAEAFFAGQKSVDDVAGLIQNRVQLYVNENM